jgi:hypothetical protein
LIKAMSLFKSFLPDEANRRLFPAFILFCIGATGGAICLVASILSIRWLYNVGFGIGFCGSAAFVLYAWWHVFTSGRK